MSTLKVANVIFDSVGTNRIDYVGGNINITSANTNINGRITANNAYANAFYSISNTSYYFSPANTSSVNKISTNDFILSGVSYLTKGGISCMMMLRSNGTTNKLYTAASTNGYLNYYSLARGGNGYVGTYGLDNFKVVNFPNETAGPIQVGGTYTVAFALFANGNLYTWGANSYGECGVGTTAVVPNPVLAATGVTAVWRDNSALPAYGLASRIFIKKTDNYIYGTGYNGYGQLGDTTTANKSSFTQLTGLGTTVTSVWPMGNDYGYTFFQKSDGTIWGAGYNGYGQLGNGNTTSQSTPVNVTTNWGGGTGYNIVKVTGLAGYHSGSSSTAYGFAAMLLDNGTTTVLKTCGINANGNLGDATTTDKSTPVTPNVGAGRISDIVVAAGWSVGCLKADGTFYVWGYNGYGQLGLGNTTATYSTPTVGTTGVLQMFGDNDAYVQPHVGQFFVRKSDGLYAAGYNGHGELGVGDTTDRSSWTKVLLPGDLTVTLMGNFNSDYPVRSYLAAGSDGRMFAWGYNGRNEITGSTTQTCVAPIQIKLPLGA